MTSPARSLRIPEPPEIVAWVASTPQRLWRFAVTPEQQVLWGLLALAAVLRLASMDLIPFSAAQATHILQARAILFDASQTAKAIGTPGDAPLSLFHYVLALLLWLRQDPRSAVVLFAVINIGALLVFHRIVDRNHGVRTATISTALLAASPWAVLSVRDIAPAALALPLSVLLLVGLDQALVGRDRSGWTLAAMGAVLLSLSSAWGIPTVIAGVALIVCFARRARWSHIVLGVLLALLLALPAIHLTGSNAPLTFVDAWQRGATAPGPFGNARALVGLRSWYGIGLLDAVAASDNGTIRPVLGVAGMVGSLGGWLLLLTAPALAYLAIRAWSHWRESQDWAAYALPLFMVVIPVLVYEARGMLVGPEQLVTLLPAGTLGMGLVVTRVLDIANNTERRRQWRPATAMVTVWVLVLSLVAWGAYTTLYLYRHVGRHQGSLGHGSTFRSWDRTMRLVSRGEDLSPLGDVWIATEGTLRDRAELQAVLSALTVDRDYVILMGNTQAQTLPLPAERQGVYLSFLYQETTSRILESLGAEEVGAVVVSAPDHGVRLLVAPGRPASEVLATIPHREWAAFDAGLRLVGHDVPYVRDQDGALMLATYWTFENIPAIDRHMSHLVGIHLYDREGRFLSHQDTVGLDEETWYQGILYKQWHTLALPEEMPTGPYEIRITVDRVQDGYRHRLLDRSGQAIGDAVIIGPFAFAEP